jgi:hypothetical protein
MKDGNGKELKVGDRVWAFDFDGTKCYGVLCENDYPMTSADYPYYIKYDDGAENLVVDFSLVWKAETPA